MAPRIANDLTIALAAEAGFVDFAVCMDNTYAFFKSYEEAEILPQKFQKIATDNRVTCSDCSILTKGDVLGAHIDLTKGAVDVSQKDPSRLTGKSHPSQKHCRLKHGGKQHPSFYGASGYDNGSSGDS